MLNKVIGVLILLAILIYLFGIISGNAYVYILCFFMLVFSILFALFVLVMNLSWKLLPGRFKKRHELKKSQFVNVFIFSVILCYSFSGIIGEILKLDLSSSINSIFQIVIFVNIVFLGHSLIKQRQTKKIIINCITFFLFVSLLSLYNFIPLKGGGTSIDTIDQLRSLPYLNWVPVEKKEDRARAGVTKYNPKLAFDGLNLYCSQTLPEAYLINMHGDIVHRWSRKIEGCDSWADHVKLNSKGELIVVCRDKMLIKLDWKSNLKWKKKMQVHHDVAIDEDENIYVLAKNRELAFWHGLPVPIVNDYIAVLSPNGDLHNKIYIYDMVREHIDVDNITEIYAGLLKIIKPRNVMKIFLFRVNSLKEDLLTSSRSYSVSSHNIDLLHTNTIEILNRDIKGFCKKGDWLISIRNLNLVAVINPKKRSVRWRWGPGEIFLQHHPTLLENSNLLIFDNGSDRKFSRIVELDPLTKRIVWQYKSESSQNFYSPQRGGNQRLPNGNTLITESDKGRVFEVTQQSEIVWEFYNPETKNGGEKRGIIYRMTRITDPEIYKMIEGTI